MGKHKVTHEERRLKIIEDPSTTIEDLNYEDTKILKKAKEEFTNETIKDYYNEYKDFFVREDIERMVKWCVGEYKNSEGLSIELATKFRMDSMVLNILSKRYDYLNQDSDEEAIEIITFIIDKIGKIMAERYPEVSNSDIENIIEEVFIDYKNVNKKEYNGIKNFNVEVRKRIRKKAM